MKQIEQNLMNLSLFLTPYNKFQIKELKFMIIYHALKIHKNKRFQKNLSKYINVYQI